MRRYSIVTVVSAGIIAGFLSGFLHGLTVIIAHRYLQDQMMHLALLTLCRFMTLWAAAVVPGILLLWAAGLLTATLLQTTAPGRRLKTLAGSVRKRFMVLGLIVLFGLINIKLVLDPFLIALGAAGLAVIGGGVALFGRYRGTAAVFRDRVRGALLQRYVRRTALACSAVLAGAVLYAPVTGLLRSPAGPNIILIYLDSLRADRLGCYGYGRNTSPNIDFLARTGTRCAKVFSQAPCTYPAVFSALTSKYANHFFDAHDIVLHRKHLTMAEVLKNSGYVTAAISSSPIVTATHAGGAAGGFEQGFDEFDARPASGQQVSWRYRSPEGVIENALAWLQQNPRRKYFLLLYIMDPHASYRPPEPYASLYDPGYSGGELIRQGNPTLYGARINRGWKTEVLDRDIYHLRALYDGEITYADAQIGRLLHYLRSSGELDTTLIVLTSDHGEELFDHGGFEHCYTLYNEMIGIPLVFRLPGAVPEGKVIERTPVQALDMVPTILELARISRPACMEGASLVALMQDPKSPWRDFALSEAPFVDAKAIITSPWKYIHHFETELVKPDLCDKYRRGRELFNLAEDPDEQRNLYDTHRDNADGLYARMMKLLPPCERERLQSAKSIDLSSKARERLKSLGYLQ